MSAVAELKLALFRYALEALAVNEVSGGLLISDVLQGVPVQINAVLIMELLFGFKTNAYYRCVYISPARPQRH